MSKQKIKKLKEDPRNVLVWEEQDQTDQKKISEQTKKQDLHDLQTCKEGSLENI